MAKKYLIIDLKKPEVDGIIVKTKDGKQIRLDISEWQEI